MKRLIQLAMVLAIAIFGFAANNAHAGTQYQDQYHQQDSNQQYSDDYSQDQQYDNPQYDPDYDQNYDDQQDYNNDQNYNDQNYSDDQDYSDQQDYNNDNYNYPTGDQNFNSLSNYGQWVNVSPFGQCWRPNVGGNWRPFSQGHWVTTSYGQTWEGNEPWAWATYHYGHWIWSQQFGWVWIPGTEYTPGNVAWSYGADSIGWMPEPPYGYDYSRGYLSYVGPQNQFSMYDSGFGFNFGFGESYYPGAYRSLFFNPAYVNLCSNLWFFIGRNQFLGHNYANYYLGSNYARNLFAQRAVRVNSRPLSRDVLQRIVQKPISVVPVRERTLTLNGHRTKFVAPARQDELRRIEPRNTERFTRPAPQRDERFQRNEVPVQKMDRTFPESRRVVPQQQPRSRELYVPKQVRPDNRPDNRMEQRNDSFQQNFQRNEQLKDRRIEPNSRPDFSVRKPAPEIRTQQFPSQNRQQFQNESRRAPEIKTMRPETKHENQRTERPSNNDKHTKQNTPKDYRH